jgi:hypothetical protein
MKLSAFALTFILLAGSLLASPKDDKKVVPGAPATSEGIIYSLPRTGIRVKVKATREKFTHGPYYLYAQKMLGINGAQATDGERWNIDHISIELFSEPDPDQVYKTESSPAKMICETTNGIISGIGLTPEVQTPPVVTGTFLKKNPESPIAFTDYSIFSYYTAADSSRSGKMITKSPEMKAAEAAETIFKIRDSRFRLLTNADDEPLPDGKAFEVMVTELGKMEANYLALFIGKSTQETYEYCFDYIPSGKQGKGDVIFRFSEDRGVLPKTDLSGRPVMIDIAKLDDLASKQASLVTATNPASPASGVYYRVPGVGEIRISDGVNVLATSRAAIAQFGVVAPFPESLLDGSYQIGFNPETGTVKSIIVKPE